MTPQKESGKEGLKILLMLASVIVITAGLQAGKPVLLPIVLSGFLAIVSYPLTTFFKGRLRFPHWLAVTFTVIMDFGILVGLAYLAQYLGQDLARTVTVKYQPLMMEKIHELRAFLIERDWNNLADQMLQELPDLLNGQRIVAFSTGVMGQLASMLTFTTLILILMTFFLGEAPRFRMNINKLGNNSDTGIRKFSKALAGVQKYLIIKTLISAATGLLAFLLCYYMKVDFPLLWGIVAFALNFIPTFGSIIAAIPPTLLAMLLISPTAGIIVAGGYLVINTVLGSCLEPMLLQLPAFSSIPSSSTIPPTSRPIPAPLKRIWRCARERAWITCFPPPRRRCIPGSAALPWRRAFYPLRCAGRPAPDIFPASARCLPSCSTWCSPRTPF